MVFIDSGGYELGPDWDSTEPNQGPYEGKPFSAGEYANVLNRLPDRIPFVVTNFDWETRFRPIRVQVLAARKLFAGFPEFLHNFLIKTYSRGRSYLAIRDIVPHLCEMRDFHIIGVTEKELGSRLSDRLVNLARLRLAMDAEGLKLPIHVWGGLDPIVTPLYFFAGAEIFDGVSWLRYAYHDGVAVYRDSMAVLEHGIGTAMNHLHGMILSKNMVYMQELEVGLREFVDSGGSSFGMFTPEVVAVSFEKAYRSLCTKVPQMRRGF